MNRLSCLLLSVISLGTLNLSAQAAPDVPKNLQVPSGQELLFKMAAQGVQIYECKAKAEDANQFEWTLRAPDAVLLNDQGKTTGKHYAGPTWEANDGSKIAGQLKEKSGAPDKDTIPWLLLEAKSHEGSGKFSPVNWIQRLETTGGKAPTEGCDRVRSQSQVRVSYTANYYFYGSSTAKTTPQPDYYY
ncbi:DUF3455 domain-containing protein [Phormidesmis sp. 146-12]